MNTSGVVAATWAKSWMTGARIYPDADRLAQAAAEHVVTLAGQAIARQGRFSVALSGGSTPRPLYARLATEDFAPQTDWSNVHVFWGDERCVPPEHPDSNYGMARQSLLDHVPIPAHNVHRIHGELEPAEAALEYERVLRTFFASSTQESGTTFDLVLLGLGTDGHTASLFPRTDPLHEQKRWVAAHYADAVGVWRVTLTPPAINAAANVTFLVSGADKAQTLQQMLGGPYEPDLLPAQIIKPSSGCLLWLLDAAAAALL
jgi:6-phosphogluconolactonase